ncbi:hypothetical protein ACFYS8_27005 [Kitasatospora sp. NPDC004615]|uniref:hypothetical protein n=1 Tax=Kitasatospora sp. NPDC004615 TaxID=3364017 RepID=UPI0036B1EDD2
MTDSLPARVHRAQRDEARDACEELRAVLAVEGIVLPSLGVEDSSVFTGETLVQLGGASPTVVSGIAFALDVGFSVIRAGRGAGSVVQVLRTPDVGALVVDTRADRVGEYRATDESGRFVLAPPAGGDLWTADPGDVHAATRNDVARAEAARQTARSNRRWAG